LGVVVIPEDLLGVVVVDSAEVVAAEVMEVDSAEVVAAEVMEVAADNYIRIFLI
jgi:hypothetical protein